MWVSCPLCSSAQVSVDALEVHLRKELGYAPWACRLCGVAFEDPASAQRHPSLRHRGETRRLIVEETDELFEARIAQLVDKAQGDSGQQPQQPGPVTAPAESAQVTTPDPGLNERPGHQQTPAAGDSGQHQSRPVTLPAESAQARTPDPGLEEGVGLGHGQDQTPAASVSEHEGSSATLQAPPEPSEASFATVQPESEAEATNQSFSLDASLQEPASPTQSRRKPFFGPRSSTAIEGPSLPAVFPDMDLSRQLADQTDRSEVETEGGQKRDGTSRSEIEAEAQQRSIETSRPEVETGAEKAPEPKKPRRMGIIVTHMGAPKLIKKPAHSGRRKIDGITNTITFPITKKELSVAGILAKVNEELGGDYILARKAKKSGWHGELGRIEESEETRTEEFWEAIRVLYALSRSDWDQLTFNPITLPHSVAPEEGKRKCLKCGWPVPKQNFGNHALTLHTEERRFRCSACPWRTHFLYQMQGHVRARNHRGDDARVLDPEREESLRRCKEEVKACFGDVSSMSEGSFRCRDCDTKVLFSNLKEHIALSHLDEVVHRCTVPGCAYTSTHWGPSNARDHARRHRGLVGAPEEALEDRRFELFPIVVLLGKKLFDFALRTTHYPQPKAKAESGKTEAGSAKAK